MSLSGSLSLTGPLGLARLQLRLRIRYGYVRNSSLTGRRGLARSGVPGSLGGSHCTKEELEDFVNPAELLLYRIDFIVKVLVEFSNPLVFVRKVKAPRLYKLRLPYGFRQPRLNSFLGQKVRPPR